MPRKVTPENLVVCLTLQPTWLPRLVIESVMGLVSGRNLFLVTVGMNIAVGVEAGRFSALSD